jgi:hypothetical protein
MPQLAQAECPLEPNLDLERTGADVVLKGVIRESVTGCAENDLTSMSSK